MSLIAANHEPFLENLTPYQQNKVKDIRHWLNTSWQKCRPEKPMNEVSLDEVARKILLVTSGTMSLGDDKRAILQALDEIFMALQSQDTIAIAESMQYLTEILLTEEDEREQKFQTLTKEVSDYTNGVINRELDSQKRRKLDRKRNSLQSLMGYEKNIKPREELLQSIYKLVIGEFIGVRSNLGTRKGNEYTPLNTLTPEELLYGIISGSKEQWEYWRNWNMSKKDLKGFQEENFKWIYEDLLYHIFRLTTEGIDIPDEADVDPRTKFIMEFVRKRFPKEAK